MTVLSHQLSSIREAVKTKTKNVVKILEAVSLKYTATLVKSLKHMIRTIINFILKFTGLFLHILELTSCTDDHYFASVPVSQGLDSTE